MDNDTAAQIEEILAYATIASTPPLPPAYMRQGMFDRNPFTQFDSSLRALLTLSQFDEQCLIRMNADAPPLETGCALSLQGTVRADSLRKMDNATGERGEISR